jgi:TPR repeat protein
LQAQGLLGKLYEAGIGLPKSLENAIAWYEKAGKFEEADRCRKQLG